MGMTVTRRKDVRLPKVFQHKLADIRGGVGVTTSELGGDVLLEGAVLSAPENGLVHVLKIATLAVEAGAEDTEVRVKKHHNLLVGDAVFTTPDGTAVTITKIDTATAKNQDILTLSAALGKIPAGGFLVQATKAGENATLKYVPQSLNGTSKEFKQNSNLNTDAWLIGTTANNPLPDFVAKYLTGIINI